MIVQTTMNISILTANKTSKTSQGITKNHQSTVVKSKVIPKSSNIWKSVNSRKCVQIPTPLPTFQTLSNLLLVKVLKIPHMEILLQSTSALIPYLTGDASVWALHLSSEKCGCESPHYSPYRQPDHSPPRLVLGFWRFLTVFVCKDPIALSALNTDNNSGARHPHHRPQVTSIDFKYNAAFISTLLRKECGWVTFTVHISFE